MTPESNAPDGNRAVKLPDEVWERALASERVYSSGLFASVRLLNGTIYEEMFISNRGYVIGRLAEGLAGAHGSFDDTMLSFTTPEIEGIRIGKRHFWQKPIWVLINPQHPARMAYHGSLLAPPPAPKKRTLPPLSTMITACFFFGGIVAATVLAVIGLLYVCGWLK